MVKPNYRSPTYYELKAPPELDWRPYRPPEYQEYRRKWEQRGQEGTAEDFPLHLDVDPTNRCNLRCQMCPRTYYLESSNFNWAPDGLGDMDMGLYEKLIEEGAAKGLKSVKLNFLGEPLLYPALDRMVELAAKAGLWVMLNTNAVLLTEELSRKLLTKGLTDIFFSFDSPYKQVYEKIRVGANYEKVLENVSYFVKVKEELNLKAVQTRASLVLEEVPEGRERIIHDYIKLFRDLKVAEIGFGLPTVMERDYSVLEAPERFVCPDLFRRIFVFHDGLCGPCCGDWERRLIMGNAKIESISSIWNGKAYKSLRNAHLKGQYRSVEACRFCSVPHLSEKSL